MQKLASTLSFKIIKQIKTNRREAWSGLGVRAEGSRPRGRWFKSRLILDGCKRFASYYIKEKLKIKVAKWGTPKNYLKNKLEN
jgi:hypothetical protein